MNPESSEGRAATARLEAERDRLKREISRLANSLREHGAIEQSGDGPADRTAVETTVELQSELDDQLAEVDEAFLRLAEGTYGIDEVTGEPIDPARLEAYPAARTNI